jgi:hypothetical protein
VAVAVAVLEAVAVFAVEAVAVAGEVWGLEMTMGSSMSR